MSVSDTTYDYQNLLLNHPIETKYICYKIVTEPWMLPIKHYIRIQIMILTYLQFFLISFYSVKVIVGFNKLRKRTMTERNGSQKQTVRKWQCQQHCVLHWQNDFYLGGLKHFLMSLLLISNFEAGRMPYLDWLRPTQPPFPPPMGTRKR